jgi:hypothetical protein
MKKWLAPTLLMVFALGGIAWNYPASPAPASPSPSADLLSSAEAHRHFTCQPRHWGSMVLINNGW